MPMVDNAGLGPERTPTVVLISPLRLLPVLQVDVPTKPRLPAALTYLLVGLSVVSGEEINDKHAGRSKGIHTNKP